MPNPIVIAHHLVWTAYGWWLQHDPRGSDSQYIASEVIAELGELHRGRKKVQPAGWVIRDFYRRAHEVLLFPLSIFEVRRTITYIEKNPLPLRLPRQVSPFVKEYDGWPLHPGHCPNSPFVKALKAAGRL